MSVVINWQLCKPKNINKIYTLAKNIFARVIFMFKTFHNTFRKFITVIFCTLLLIILIYGIGIVDNCNKQAQNNPFLNTFFIDTDNYILCFRYLGVQGRFSFDINGLFSSALSTLKSLYISLIVLFTLIKDYIFGKI